MRWPSRGARLGPARALLASVVIVGTAGGTCEEYAPIRSNDVSTRDMGIALELITDEATAFVEVRLDGPAGIVQLAPGDELSARSDEGPRVLFERGEAGVYAASLAAPARALTLRLDRAPPGESVRLELDVPSATPIDVPPTFSRADALEIEWQAEDRALHQILLSVGGDCVPRIERSLGSDPGRYSFQAADFEVSDETCRVVVTLTRTAIVQPPSKLLAASGLATRISTVELESTP